MTVDPIVALESLGYTQREASFLDLVAVHSGYFLRRQFNSFIQRKKGYLSHHFIEKARIAGHIEVIDYGQGRFVYHLFAKPIYRLVGSPESQNRRRKGDAQIRARLMALDYVLENNREHYLETDEAKLDFFVRVRRVSPSILGDTYRRLHPFLGILPISVADRSRPATSVVRFPFIDEGLLSIRKFSRFVTELLPVLDATGTFEIIYTASSDLNFAAAEALFERYFSAHLAERQQILADFRNATNPARPANRVPLHAKFTRLLLCYSYPKLSRSEPQGSVQGSAAGSPTHGATL